MILLKNKGLQKRVISSILGLSMITSLCFMQVDGVNVSAEVSNKDRHYHSFGCYEDYELICDIDEEHNEDCYNGIGEIVCGIEEGDLHSHKDCNCEILEEVLICDKLESIASDSNAKIATPGQIVNGHVHNSNCYKPIYKCRQEKSLNIRGGIIHYL